MDIWMRATRVGWVAGGIVGFSGIRPRRHGEALMAFAKASMALSRCHECELFDAGGGDENAVGWILVHGSGKLHGLDGDLRGEGKESDAGFREGLLCPPVGSTVELDVFCSFEDGKFPDRDDGDEDVILPGCLANCVFCFRSKAPRGGLIAKPHVRVEEERLATHAARSTLC